MTTGGFRSAPDLDFLALLEELQGRFLDAIPGVDPAAPVPACGDWTVRDLVEHLAHIHHWASTQARAEDDPGLGDGPFDLVPHYAAQSAGLRETLRTLPADAPARVLSHPRPMDRGPASFWHRRQVHETLVHLHDLYAAAAGRADAGLVTGVTPATWADAVDEVVTMFQPRQEGLGRMQPLRVHVLLRADDVPGSSSWVLGVADPDRAREIEPDVTVTGSARSLALLIWRRLTPTEAGVTVRGERRDLDAAFGEPIVP